MAEPKRPRAPFAPWDRRELPGTFDVEESARRVGHYKWIEMRLFEALVSEASRSKPGAPPSPVPSGPDGA